MRTHFGIGIEHTKNKKDIGKLWRSAILFKVSFVLTLGKPYKWIRSKSGSYRMLNHATIMQFESLDDLELFKGTDTVIVGIEMTNDTIDIMDFVHPKKCLYLLGTEDTGLTPEALAKCHKVIKLRGVRSMNVSVAGSLVLYDRFLKESLHSQSQRHTLAESGSTFETKKNETKKNY